MRLTRAELIEVIEDVLTDPPARAVELADEYYSPYYGLFYRLSALKGGYLVELGVEKGRGSSCLAAGNREAAVIGIDATRRAEIDQVVGRFTNFQFVGKSSLPPPVEVVGLSINLLHIDTEHSYTQAKNEFTAYQSQLAPGAIVCFDDLHAMDDGVKRYFDSLPYPKVEDDRLHQSCGYGVLIYD